jgi:hypothetical protein
MLRFLCYRTLGMTYGGLFAWPTNAQSSWRDHSEVTWQFCEVLADRRRDNLCFVHGRYSCQPDKYDPERQSMLTKYQLTKILVRC